MASSGGDDGAVGEEEEGAGGAPSVGSDGDASAVPADAEQSYDSGAHSQEEAKFAVDQVAHAWRLSRVTKARDAALRQVKEMSAREAQWQRDVNRLISTRDQLKEELKKQQERNEAEAANSKELQFSLAVKNAQHQKTLEEADKRAEEAQKAAVARTVDEYEKRLRQSRITRAVARSSHARAMHIERVEAARREIRADYKYTTDVTALRAEVEHVERAELRARLELPILMREADDEAACTREAGYLDGYSQAEKEADVRMQQLRTANEMFVKQLRAEHQQKLQQQAQRAEAHLNERKDAWRNAWGKDWAEKEAAAVAAACQATLSRALRQQGIEVDEQVLEALKMAQARLDSIRAELEEQHTRELDALAEKHAAREEAYEDELSQLRHRAQLEASTLKAALAETELEAAEATHNASALSSALPVPDMMTPQARDRLKASQAQLERAEKAAKKAEEKSRAKGVDPANGPDAALLFELKLLRERVRELEEMLRHGRAAEPRSSTRSSMLRTPRASATPSARLSAAMPSARPSVAGSAVVVGDVGKSLDEMVELPSEPRGASTRSSAILEEAEPEAPDSPRVEQLKQQQSRLEGIVLQVAEMLDIDVAPIVALGHAESEHERARRASAPSLTAGAELPPAELRRWRSAGELPYDVATDKGLAASLVKATKAAREHQRRVAEAEAAARATSEKLLEAVQTAAKSEARARAAEAESDMLRQQASQSAQRGKLLVRAEARRSAEEGLWRDALRDSEKRLTRTEGRLDAETALNADTNLALAKARRELAAESTALEETRLELDAARDEAQAARINSMESSSALRAREAGFSRAWHSLNAEVASERTVLFAERNQLASELAQAQARAAQATESAGYARDEIERLARALATMQMQAHQQERADWLFMLDGAPPAAGRTAGGAGTAGVGREGAAPRSAAMRAATGRSGPHVSLHVLGTPDAEKRTVASPQPRGPYTADGLPQLAQTRPHTASTAHFHRTPTSGQRPQSSYQAQSLRTKEDAWAQPVPIAAAHSLPVGVPSAARAGGVVSSPLSAGSVGMARTPPMR